MKPIQKKTIGVIGFGNFGKVICTHLFPRNKIFILTNNLNSSLLPPNGEGVDNLTDLVMKSDIIIPAIPINKFEEVIRNIAPKMKDKILLDICSVMEFPVEIMKRILQTDVKMLATHPMFGPSSIKKNNDLINNFKIVISNISLDEKLYQQFKDYFSSISLNVIELNPKEHDEFSAKSQFFALVTGQIAQSLDLKKTQIDTPGANAIFDAMDYIGKDREIIEDMIKYNRFCKKMNLDIISLLEDLGGINNG